jgi:hypothetical protein
VNQCPTHPPDMCPTRHGPPTRIRLNHAVCPSTALESACTGSTPGNQLPVSKALDGQCTSSRFFENAISAPHNGVSRETRRSTCDVRETLRDVTQTRGAAS